MQQNLQMDLLQYYTIIHYQSASISDRPLISDQVRAGYAFLQVRSM